MLLSKKNIITTLILLMSCSNNKEQEKDHINNFITIINEVPGAKQKFKYIDYIGSSEYIDLDNDTVKISSDQPITSYSYKNANNVKYYFIKPNDTVYIKLIDGNNVPFSNNKNNNRLLKLMSKFSFSLGSINFENKSSYDVGKQQIEASFQLKNDIIERFGESVDDKEFMKRFVVYDKFTSLLVLCKKFNKTDKVFEDVIKNVVPLDTNMITFKLFVNNFNSYTASNNSYNVSTYFKKVENEYPEIVKSYVLFDLIKSYQPYSEQKVDTLKSLIKRYSSISKNLNFINYLNKNLEKITGDKSSEKDDKVQVLNLLSDKKISFDDVLAQHKGKLIYMDIWASWCIPCVSEMPYSKSLYAELKAKSLPVEFIYISEDENMAAWVKKSKEMKLPNERSFLFLKNNALQKFLNQYEIKSIPRYLLFNKKGMIIDSDALRPSDKILKEKIIKLCYE